MAWFNDSCFLTTLSTICLLCLIHLLYGKASKKREDMQGLHEGITTRLFMLLLYPSSWRLISSMKPCLSICPSLSCYNMCLATCLYKLWLLLLQSDLTPLSSCPSKDDITPSLSWYPPACILSLFHLSVFLVSHSFFLLLFFSLSLCLSCRLFIRCVNNCLPTVVIAPPCQPEVWSKCQCV